MERKVGQLERESQAVDISSKINRVNETCFQVRTHLVTSQLSIYLFFSLKKSQNVSLSPDKRYKTKAEEGNTIQAQLLRTISSLCCPLQGELSHSHGDEE